MRVSQVLEGGDAVGVEEKLLLFRARHPVHRLGRRQLEPQGLPDFPSALGLFRQLRFGVESVQSTAEERFFARATQCTVSGAVSSSRRA